jgi:DNA-binding GntR family transcriptional regulator
MISSQNRTNGKQPLASAAYEKIYQKIITLEYEPGVKLEENQLVEQLGLGRTPVREALLRLVSDMIVESHSNIGFIVRPITLQNTKSVFTALQILELGVADLAVQHDISAFLPPMAEANQAVKAAMKEMDILKLVDANSAFHRQFALCSKNEYLVMSLHKVRCESNRLAYLSYGNEIDPARNLQEHYDSVVREHDDIITGLKTRDIDRLQDTLCQHIRTFQKRIIHYMGF